MAQQQQRYKVIEKIASGGMAEVFRAESAGLEGFKKTVAIKRVLPHLSEKKQFIGMFLDEARVSAHLSHSNCVQVFDIGVGDNTYFIVMEYVDGSDLKAVAEHFRASRQQFPMEEACLIAVRICEGLTYAHELRDGKDNPLNIVHRDMSPPNVLITRFGEVKIVDFGLAKANSQLEQSEPGIIKGKFSYLSPEAAQGMEVDARTDIFAVGIILWELLAGRRLFLGQSDLETVRMVQRVEVPPIRELNRNVTPELEAVLARALSGDPTRRYQRARDFGHELNQVLFHFDRAVSSFDISQLVEPIWRARASRRKQGVDRRSIIGSLIDEALLEFTSLEAGERASTTSQVAASALNIGSFEDVQDWAGDLGIVAASGSHQASDLVAGNLSALEDDSNAPPPPSAPGESAHDAAPSRPASEVDVDALPDITPASRGKSGIIAAVAVLIIAAGAAGAYFSGLVP
jgi:serine/threonine-protein kinase